MPKHIDWDAVARSQRAQRHGTEYAYDELPPVGSYADQARYLSGKGESDSTRNPSSRTKQLYPHKKNKPTRDERLRNLRRTLQELIVIPGNAKWNNKGLEYQQHLLAQMRSTLSSMLKLAPSANSDPVSIEADRLLVEYGFTNSGK